jgi:hypothetical protein
LGRPKEREERERGEGGAERDGRDTFGRIRPKDKERFIFKFFILINSKFGFCCFKIISSALKIQVKNLGTHLEHGGLIKIFQATFKFFLDVF